MCETKWQPVGELAREVVRRLVRPDTMQVGVTQRPAGLREVRTTRRIVD